MGKTEVNNEIVLMRPVVRQCRVRIVHKLTREIKLLRKRYGDEKQREKFNKKVDRLANEILALKKVNDDDISKFGITNTKTLPEVLVDTSSTPKTCILTRIVNYQTLKDRIGNFKNKFPDYEQYLDSGKKKSKKKKRSNKNNVPPSKSQKTAKDSETQMQSTNEQNEIIADDNDKEEIDNASERNKENLTVSDEDDSLPHNLEPGSLIRIKKSSDELASEEDESNETNDTPSPIKNVSSKDKSQLAKRNKQTKKVQQNIPPLKQTVGPVKVVSKEATVKRFTEILQEQSSENNTSLSPEDIESKNVNGFAVVPKEADDFFMTGDGNNTYLSVSVPKTNQERAPEIDNDIDNNYKKQRYLTKERFFSKIEKCNGSTFRGKRGAEQRQEDRIPKKQASFERKGRKFDSEKKRKDFDVHRNGFKSANADDSTSIENLHPSWAAKRKQQEMIKQGFQGKKIVFDDE